MITLVENGRDRATACLRELFPHTGRCRTLGVTGAPGSGKSTLVDCLATQYRNQGARIGIIAVDPSSPFSGGAILGDRIRMQSRSVDPAVFIRSMATRGHLGGLSRSTFEAILVLDAAGFENVLIETVGVGQDEIDIVRAAQIILVLLVPGMGDEIQAMKAGIMEIGDVFVINKADRPGAARLEKELVNLVSMSNRSDGWKPPVVRTTATSGKGVEECISAIESYRDFLRQSERDKVLSVARYKDRLLDLVQSEFLNHLLNDRESAEMLQSLAQKVEDRDLDPYTAAEELIRRAIFLKSRTEG